jgi:hypothetical protein
MQLMPETTKKFGVKNPFDPQENIAAGAKLLADNLKATGGNLREALMMYHAGPNRKGWGPLTMAYPGKVLGGNSKELGESRELINKKTVQQNIASRLGVDVRQIQMGLTNKDDVKWASRQLMAGTANNAFDIQKQLMNVMLPKQTRSKLMNDLREQSLGMQMMEQFTPEIEDKAKEGPRSITIGENAIVVNVQGVENPGEFTRMLDEHLQNSLGDIANYADGVIKY